MKKIIYLLMVSLLFTGCKYGDLNDNPNEPTEVPATLLITGTMLADISINASHIQRISGMWSGQYKGFQNVYGNMFNYNISTEESNSSWGYLYNGIIAQNQIIQEQLATDRLVVGITKVVQAHAVGTAAANWGDIPYLQAVAGIDDPVFDPQREVYSQLQILLDSAIADLNSVDGYALSEDIFFNGDKTKWIQTAYTLKARYYMITKEYPQAYTAAQNGISTYENSMMYNPPGVQSGDQNLLFEFLSGSRSGDMGTDETYLASMLQPVTDNTRNNAKTNEDARSKYYYIDASGSATTGVASASAPMPLVTYQENLLTLAEAAARTRTFGEALGYLNDVRMFLASGNAFEKVDAADVLLYDAYVAADFETGGMENPDNITADKALLREIIQERYVSGFGTFMPWNDARRLRKSDADVMVNFPLNTTAVTTYPERFQASQFEINSNTNAPTQVSIFTPTPVNE